MPAFQSLSSEAELEFLGFNPRFPGKESVYRQYPLPGPKVPSHQALLSLWLGAQAWAGVGTVGEFGAPRSSSTDQASSAG